MTAARSVVWRTVLSLGAAAFTVFYVFKTLSATSVEAVFEAAAEIGGLRAGLGLSCYLAAHVVRAVRLALLVDDEKLSLRELVRAQLVANGPSLALPLKLGELYRLLVFVRAVGNGLKAAVAIVTERILDFCVIFLALMIVLLIERPVLVHGGYFATLGTLFLFSVLLVLFVVPENIETLQIYVIRRYHTPLAVRILTGLQRAQAYIRESKRLLSRKVGTIALLSVTVWSLEIAAVLVLFAPFAGVVPLVLLALHIFLSGLLPVGPAGQRGLPLAFATMAASASAPRLAESAVVYQWGVFLPGAALSLLLWWRAPTVWGVLRGGASRLSHALHTSPEPSVSRSLPSAREDRVSPRPVTAP